MNNPTYRGVTLTQALKEAQTPAPSTPEVAGVCPCCFFVGDVTVFVPEVESELRALQKWHARQYRGHFRLAQLHADNARHIRDANTHWRFLRAVDKLLGTVVK